MGATTINQAALDEVLYGPTQPIMRHLYTVAEEIKAHARARINRSDKSDGVHLEDTGIVEDTLVVGRPGFIVAFEASYVGFLYGGTQPHVIRARNARSLAFKWPKAGPGIWRFASVRHPGTSPHPFLHEAVVEMFGVQLP